MVTSALSTGMRFTAAAPLIAALPSAAPDHVQGGAIDACLAITLRAFYHRTDRSGGPLRWRDGSKRTAITAERIRRPAHAAAQWRVHVMAGRDRKKGGR